MSERGTLVRGNTLRPAMWEERHLRALRQAFPQRPTLPTHTLSEIQYQAGIDAVLAYIEKQVNK